MFLSNVSNISYTFLMFSLYCLMDFNIHNMQNSSAVFTSRGREIDSKESTNQTHLYMTESDPKR